MVENIPRRFTRDSTTYQTVKSAFQFLRVNQTWRMFAPGPPIEELSIEAQIHFSDGQMTPWNPPEPRPQTLSPVEYARWQRWTKALRKDFFAPGQRLVLIRIGEKIFQALEPENRDRVTEIRFFQTSQKTPAFENKVPRKSPTEYPDRKSTPLFTYLPHSPDQSISFKKATE